MKMGIEAQRRVAVATAEGNHSYGQLLASAWKLSNTLLEDNLLKSSVDEAVGGVKSRITAYPSMGSKQTTNGKISQLVREMNDITSLNGARIGIMSKPSAEFVAGIWATWISGAVAVPLALSHPEAEILYVMNDADVSFVMGTEDYQGILKGIAKRCSARFCLIPSVPKLPMDFRASEVFHSRDVKHDSSGILSEEVLTAVKKLAVADGDKPALIVYTSGTTGKPKGVVHTHRSIAAQVPTIYARLLQGYELMGTESQKAAASAARQLRLMMCGSSALPYPVMEQWEKITGHRLLERYGMTEFGMALSNPLRGNRKVGTVGKPLPGVQVKIVSQIEINCNKPSIGELYVKSPSMFKEYWRQPQVTKESFGDDGYFKTGDTAMMDEDSCFVILGRTSVDILKVGGYKLSALEIEAALLEHPDIAECCVLGLPDTDYGEIICAVIVLKSEAHKTAAFSKPVFTIKDLHRWAKERIAPYKIPERLHIWESIPRNAMGKVNKKELKQLLLTA